MPAFNVQCSINECVKWEPKCSVLRDLSPAWEFRSNGGFIVANRTIFTSGDIYRFSTSDRWRVLLPGECILQARERSQSDFMKFASMEERAWIKIGAGCDDIGVEIKQIRHVHILCISNLFFKNIRNKTLTRYLQRGFSYLMLFRGKRESDTRFINERFYSSLETHLIEIR